MAKEFALPTSAMRLRREKKKANVTKGSETGKIKRLVPSGADKVFAKNNRSYKYPGYEKWSGKYRGLRNPNQSKVK